MEWARNDILLSNHQTEDNGRQRPRFDAAQRIGKAVYLPRSQEKQHDLTKRKFYKAEQEAGFVENHPKTTPQQQDPAYRLAFRDTDFLLREELRPVRFQLELLKTEMLLEEADIGSTLVVYGSARIPSPDMAETALATATTPERKAQLRTQIVRRLIPTDSAA